MKAYQISAKQLVMLALVTSVFAASAVLFYDRFGPTLLGRIVGAKVDTLPASEGKIAGLTDPSVASDERNNQEIYNALSPGVVNITTTTLVRDWFAVYETQGGSGPGGILDKKGPNL